MDKIMFSLLLVGSAGGVGLALISSWLSWKLYQIDHDEIRRAMITIMLGMAVQNGVLLFALASIGTTTPSGRVWLYLLGVSIVTVGLGWLTKFLIVLLAQKENSE